MSAGKFADIDIDFESHTLERGQLIIWEAQLTDLTEQLEHLIHRAQFYDEVPGATAFIETIEDIKARVNQIRRTSQGEA